MVSAKTSHVLLLVFCSFLLVSPFAVTGCSSTAGLHGKPLPDMTFEHVEPLPLKVATVEVINKYSPGGDEQDVSASLPTPPDIALRRYAERRLQNDDVAGALKFVIEDAYVHHKEIVPEKGIMSWMKSEAKDIYNVVMKIRMYSLDAQGLQSDHSILTFRRSITIPQSYSLSEKEYEQFKFIEDMVAEVDGVVTSTLMHKLNLVSDAYVPVVKTKKQKK